MYMEYLAIGCVFTLFVDASIYYQKVEQMNNLERFVCILLWPFAVVNFIYGFIKGLFKQNKDD